MYERSQITAIEDKLHFCREHKMICERELDKREFQYKCLPQKREAAKREIIGVAIPFVSITVVLLVIAGLTIYSLVSCVGAYMAGDSGGPAEAVIIMLGFLVLYYGGLYAYKMGSYVIERILALSRYKDEEFFLTTKIYNNRRRIEELDEEILELQMLQKEAENGKE